MRATPPALIATLTLGLALSACSPTPPDAPQSASPTPTSAVSEQSGQSGSSSTPDPADAPADRQPDNAPLPTPTIPTLPADVLAYDPITVDRTDPDALAAAFVATALTYDTSVDKTSTYGSARAATYLSQTLKDQQANPDNAAGQGEYQSLAAHQGYVTMRIDDVYVEGLDAHEGRIIARGVDYTRTLHYRDATPETVTTGRAWVTMSEEDGHLAVSDVHW